MLAQKALQGTETETRELLGGTASFFAPCILATPPVLKVYQLDFTTKALLSKSGRGGFLESGLRVQREKSNQTVCVKYTKELLFTLELCDPILGRYQFSVLKQIACQSCTHCTV